MSQHSVADMGTGSSVRRLGTGTALATFVAFLSLAGFSPKAQAQCDPGAQLSVRADVVVGKAPLTVLFHGGVVGDQADQFQLSWDFDDGAFAGNTDMVSHVYSKPGSYLVKLKGTNVSNNCTTSASVFVLVNEDTNETPTARFVAQVGEGDAPISAIFTSTGDDPDGRIILHEWSFGDGGFATGSEVVHNYESNGTYLVRLTVTDDRGGKDFTIRTIVIGEGENALQAGSANAEPNPTDTNAIALQTCGGAATPSLTLMIAGLMAMKVHTARRRK